MENTLERMVDKIYREGITRAEEKADSIIADARKVAAETEKKAREEAEQIVQQAERKAAEITRATKADLQNLASTTLGHLRHEISTLLQKKVVSEPLKHALSDTHFIKDLLIKIAGSQPMQGLVLQVPVHLRDSLVADFTNAMQENLRGLEITGDKRKSGFSIVQKENDFEIEFTEESLSEFLQPYIKPAIAELFRKE